MSAVLKLGEIMKHEPQIPVARPDRSDEIVQELKRTIVGYAINKVGLSEKAAEVVGERVVAIVTK